MRLAGYQRSAAMPGFDEAVPKLLLLGGPELPASVSPSRRLLRPFSRLDAARDTVARLRTITSVVIPDTSFLRNPEHRELYLSGLRLAMGEGGDPRLSFPGLILGLMRPNPA